MNCEAARARLMEAVYGELPPEAVAAFEEHLAGCEECRLTYEQLLQTDRALDVIPDTAARVDVAQLYRQAATRDRRSRLRWRRVALAAAAGLLVAATLAVWRGRVEVGNGRLVISWQATADQPAAEQQTTVDSAAMLADHARHLATLDETVALLLAELDASERQRLALLIRLERQIDELQRRSNTRMDLVQEDIRDLYLARFSSTEDIPGDQP